MTCKKPRFLRTVIPEDQPRVALRLRRQLMAVYSYLFVWAVTILGTRLGLVSPHTPHEVLFGLTLGINGIFFALIRSGYSNRWRDPALTIPQMVLGILLATALIHYSIELEGALFTIYFMVMLFGVFALNRVRMLLMSLLVVGSYLGMLVFELQADGAQALPGAALGRLIILALGLTWFVYVGGHISNLRARVRQQRADLQGQRTELEASNQQLEEALHRLEELAIRDPLTNLYNRRYFLERLDEELTRVQRDQSSFHIGLIDLDHFKQVNDTHGHNAGDAVLREFARCARTALRRSDLLARYGGEEFIVLFRDGSSEDIQGVAERLRRSFAECSPNATPDGQTITISVGVTLTHPRDRLDSVIERADQALYRAKKAGRDRVTGLDENQANPG